MAETAPSQQANYTETLLRPRLRDHSYRRAPCPFFVSVELYKTNRNMLRARTQTVCLGLVGNESLPAVWAECTGLKTMVGACDT